VFLGIGIVGLSGCDVRPENEQEGGKNTIKVRPDRRPLPTGSVTAGTQPEPPVQPPESCVAVSLGEELDFGDVAVGEALEKSITVRNSCGYEVMVAGLSIDGISKDAFSIATWFAAPALIVANGRHAITVRFEPAVDGEAEATVVINTSSTAGGEGSLKLRLRGKGGAP
jgi:hypothetical protein